jgi:subtilisin family serine protease
MGRHKDKDTAEKTAEDGNANAGKFGYRIFASIGAAAGGIVARKALNASWRQATGKEPPTNPEHPDVRWGEALSWAIASAGVVAAAKLLAQRRVAATWRRASGSLPPGLDESGK